MYHEILVTWNENIGSIIDESIIRCNYSNKLSYWNDDMRKEKWNQDAYKHNDTIP